MHILANKNYSHFMVESAPVGQAILVGRASKGVRALGVWLVMTLLLTHKKTALESAVFLLESPS